jgi:hypothetical protein
VTNCDNLETVSKRRLTKRIGSLDSTKLVVLDDALRYALGIRTRAFRTAGALPDAGVETPDPPPLP